MKQSIRFFSIGLLTASLLLLGFYYFLNDSVASSDIPVEDMIAEIESNGHRVITEKEFIAYTIKMKQKSIQIKRVKKMIRKKNLVIRRNQMTRKIVQKIIRKKKIKKTR